MFLLSFTTLLILMAAHTVCCLTVVNATVGAKVTLPCHTDLSDPVDWRYKQHDTDEGEYVFIGGIPGVNWPHHSRTELSKLTVTAGDYNRTIYNLTLHNLTVRDTGIYTCIEDVGAGSKHPFLLNVRRTRRVINATAGQKDVILPCHTEHDYPVDWKYRKNDAAMEEIHIFSAGKPGTDWKHYDRTELTSEAGDYSLVIHSLTVNDTGEYTCIEDEGYGNIHPFWLQVYYSDPVAISASYSFAGLTDVVFGATMGSVAVFLMSIAIIAVIWYMRKRRKGIQRGGAYELVPVSAARTVRQSAQRLVGTIQIQARQIDEVLLELLLLKSFILYYMSQYKTHEAVRNAYRTLAAVSYTWCQSLSGWRQDAATRHLFKRKLRHNLKLACRPYMVFPRQQSSLPVSGDLCSVTVCDNKLFVVCRRSNSILVFGHNNEPLTDIIVEQLKSPTDIVSCTETQQLYVAGTCRSRDFTCCVWRVSLDDCQVVKWLPNKLSTTTTTSQFRPETLSVTSRQLLVTSEENNELLLYGADGVELKRVLLPDSMTSLQHAVETSHGTFIVSYRKPQPGICEVNGEGHVTSNYCDQQQLTRPVYLSLDSDGRIIVADTSKDRVLLLRKGEKIELERVLLDTHHLTEPSRLCYTRQTGQLAVAGRVPGTFLGSDCVHVFTVRRATNS